MSGPGHGSGAPRQYCQHPDCTYQAVRSMRRGMWMAPMALCEPHSRLFHVLGDVEARKWSDARQSVRWGLPGQGPRSTAARLSSRTPA